MVWNNNERFPLPAHLFFVFVVFIFLRGIFPTACGVDSLMRLEEPVELMFSTSFFYDFSVTHHRSASKDICVLILITSIYIICAPYRSSVMHDATF